MFFTTHLQFAYKDYLPHFIHEEDAKKCYEEKTVLCCAVNWRLRTRSPMSLGTSNACQRQQVVVS
jgi:hypothetical protein